MALTTEAGLQTALNSAQEIDFVKASGTAEGSGPWHSCWTLAGLPPAGANPPAFGTGTNYRPTQATTGAANFANASGSKSLLVSAARMVKGSTGRVRLCDRLWACSGFNTTTLTTQTIVSASSYPVNRGNTNGIGVEPWLEVYTTDGATGATWTMNFQDAQAGGVVAGTYVHPANAEAVGSMMPVTLADGTLSVSYAIDFICSASSGTAGDVGITLLRPILEWDLTEANREQMMGYLETALAKIENNACLMLMVHPTGTSSGALVGSVQVIES